MNFLLEEKKISRRRKRYDKHKEPFAENCVLQAIYFNDVADVFMWQCGEYKSCGNNDSFYLAAFKERKCAWDQSGRSVETLIRDGSHGIKFFRSSRAYLVIPAETGDSVSGLGDEHEVVHVLQRLADAMAAAVAALGLARVVRRLLRALLHLQTEAFQKVWIKICTRYGKKEAKRAAKTRLINYRVIRSF